MMRTTKSKRDKERKRKKIAYFIIVSFKLNKWSKYILVLQEKKTVNSSAKSHDEIVIIPGSPKLYIKPNFKNYH
jgi:hypothetical protein